MAAEHRQTSSPENGKRRSRETTMEKLRRSGLELFAKHGFDGATTKMIAEHAEVNEALITRYFGTKEGLLNAIIRDYTRQVEARASGYPAGTTLEEELVNFLTVGIAVAGRHPAFFKLLLSQAILSPPFRRTMTRELQRMGEKRLLGRLREYQERKIIDRSADLEGTIEILRLFVAGIVVARFAATASVVNTTRVIEQVAQAVASTLKASR